MSFSYHIGDKVRILSWMELMEKCGEPDKDGDICDDEFGDVFLGRMFDYCNSVGAVVRVDEGGFLLIEVGTDKSYWWMSPNFVQLLPPKPDTKDLTLNFEDIFR